MVNRRKDVEIFAPRVNGHTVAPHRANFRQDRISPLKIPDRNSILSLIGNTPLVKIRNITGDLPAPVEIYAKAEWFNPGGSVKDRAALSMILDGERRGLLLPGKTIIDATSGNTGIAYAMIGAARGYKVTLALPENASPARRKMLRAYGAKLILTDSMDGTDGAQCFVKNFLAENPERAEQYFYPDQYNNPANWMAHYHGTAVEILRQTGERITHFVAGLGTTGTFTGIARRMKAVNKRIRTISFQPDSPYHGLEGMKHLETAIVPGIYDAALVDENLEIDTETAFEMTRRLAREEGLFVGVSAGAAMAAALKVAKQIDKGVIVTIFPDGGSKYLSEDFWEDK